MVKRCCVVAAVSRKIENPPEYAVSTLSLKKRATILCFQTTHPSLFIHTTSPTKRLKNSAMRFEREI